MNQFALMGLGFGSLTAAKNMIEYKVPKDETMYTTNTSN